MFTIQQRDVPEQLVLTEQRHVKAASCRSGYVQREGD